ncbi:hypothetical protein AB6A40_004470 [Gnathostoma spinigerum]|uniref:Uncharacterized protein n=1 Tax=Gnathostoma spinigerum TaxID=75299 RepID=A0ABD6EEW6_9BILA
MEQDTGNETKSFLFENVSERVVTNRRIKESKSDLVIDEKSMKLDGNKAVSLIYVSRPTIGPTENQVTRKGRQSKRYMSSHQ